MEAGDGLDKAHNPEVAGQILPPLLESPGNGAFPFSPRRSAASTFARLCLGGRLACAGRQLGATVFGMSAEPIRAAYEALMTGDVDSLVSLIHPDMEWSGRRRVTRLWQRPPS